MRKRTLAALSLATLAAVGTALLAVAAPTFAADARPLDTTPNLTHDQPAGYYLWRSDGTLHLRTHGPGAEHDFDAVLRTDGVFDNVDPVQLDPRNNDRVELRDGGHALVIHFHTFDFTDGVNFTIHDGAHLR